MGQAKQRGTFEKRRQHSKTMPNDKTASDLETALQHTRDSGLDAANCSLLLSYADTKRVLNAVHERAWKLLNVWQSACYANYRKPDGTQPTKAELDMLYEGQKAHFELQGKIQEVLKANANIHPR